MTKNYLYNTGLAILFLILGLGANAEILCAQADTVFYKNALDQVNSDTEQFPYTYKGRLELGNSLAVQDYFDSAIEVYDRLLNDYPDNPDVLLMRGRAYGWMGNFDRAKQDLRAVLQQNSDYPDAWQILGNVYRWSNRSDSAVSAYSEWIDIEPDRPDPYIHRGRAYRDQSKFDHAREDFRTARRNGAEPDQIPPIGARSRKVANTSHEWRAKTGYRRTDISQGRSNWTRYNMALEKTMDRATVTLETFRVEHFNTWNTGFVLDTYLDIEEGRYLNVRYQTSPQHDFLAKSDILMEGYQSLGSGWEGSLGYRTMDFNNNEVDIRKVGIARYWGQWYARWVFRDIANNSSEGTFNTLSFRRFLDGSDNFVELSAGSGDEVVEVSRSNPAGTLDTESYGARYQYYFDKSKGVNFNFNYVGPEGQPIRRSATLEFLRRW